MKLLRLFKNLGSLQFILDDETKYFLQINGERVEKISVDAYRAHHEMYKLLRELRTPQYDKIFLLRNKKAFNTFGFNQKYDVIVAARNGVVIDLKMNVPSDRISKHYKDGHYIYFAPVGTIKFYSLKVKDIFAITKNWFK